MGKIQANDKAQNPAHATLAQRLKGQGNLDKIFLDAFTLGRGKGANIRKVTRDARTAVKRFRSRGTFCDETVRFVNRMLTELAKRPSQPAPQGLAVAA